MSLTSIICKEINEAPHKRTQPFSLQHNADLIFGCSTPLNFCGSCYQQAEALGNGKSVDCVFMDFEKVFNAVLHARQDRSTNVNLITLDKKHINWIQQYLHGKK